MDLSAIVQKQIEADEKRGFTVRFDSDIATENQLTRDTVGLMGEIGEFANLLKKVSLSLKTEGYVGPTLAEASEELREELADAAIDIIRLSALLGANLEHDILAKMEKNNARYRVLEK